MDEIQIKHERTVGDAFVAWLNKDQQKQFVYDSRPQEAPDLRYVDDQEILSIEIADAYYDGNDAAMKWQAARKKDDAAHSWSGVNFDAALTTDISKRIAEKCSKNYGANCALVVNVYPSLTTIQDMEQMILNIGVPKQSPFVGIYLTGHFPSSSSSVGGFGCWRLA